MSKKLFIFEDLSPGPNCNSCPLSLTGECIGYAALQAMVDASTSYATLAERGGEAATIVQARMLGEATALRAFTNDATPAIVKLQADLNSCEGAVPFSAHIKDQIIPARFQKRFIPGTDSPKSQAYDNADTVKNAADQILAAASPSFDQKTG